MGLQSFVTRRRARKVVPAPAKPLDAGQWYWTRPPTRDHLGADASILIEGHSFGVNFWQTGMGCRRNSCDGKCRDAMMGWGWRSDRPLPFGQSLGLFSRIERMIGEIMRAYMNGAQPDRVYVHGSDDMRSKFYAEKCQSWAGMGYDHQPDIAPHYRRLAGCVYSHPHIQEENKSRQAA